MKKNLFLLAAIAFAMGMQTGAGAAESDSISVIVNGEAVEFEQDQTPVIENGRTLVPFRAVLEKMGASVDWDNDTQTVTCSLEGKQVSLVIGSDKMTANSGEIRLDVPAKIINSRTMVPIRAISEGLGAHVDWDGENRVVTVTGNAVERHEGYSILSLSNDIMYGDTVIVPITVKYPAFDNAPAANAKIAQQAQSLAQSYHDSYSDSAESYFKQIDTNDTNWYITVNFDVKYDSPEFVSMYRQDNIYTAGSHDNIVVGGLTLDRDNGTEVEADQIVPNAYENALKGIESLAKNYAKTYGDTYKNYKKPNKDSFYFDGAVVYVMPPYEIAPFSEGVIQYRVVEQQSQTGSYTFKNLVSEIKNGENTVFTITAKYPVIDGDTTEIKEVNNAIEADAKARIKACEDEFGSDAREFAPAEGKTSADWSCEINYQVKSLDEAIVSAYITEVSYMGGAHPNTSVSGLTYNLQTGQRMTAEDFLEDALNKGKEGIRAIAQADPEQYPFYDDTAFKLTDDSFYIEDAQLVFVVQQYEIAPYARGIVEYRINLEGI